MSVEDFVISELVYEGSPKKAFEQGISAEDFDLADEEFRWIVDQTERKLPVNVRRFKKKFPDFDLVRSGERLQDLIDELKQERMFISLKGLIDELDSNLEHENSYEKAVFMVETGKDLIKKFSESSIDVFIKTDWKHHIEEQKRIGILAERGETVGIPTNIPHLDHHWGGLQGGNLYCVLGRPGDAKSFLLAKLATEAMLDGRRVGFFSPEMNERQHRCRFSTLLSHDSKIQKACGLDHSFRNRALMEGKNYNIKKYRRFLEFCEQEVPGEICLFTNKWRRTKMSAGYIEAKVEDLGLEIIVIDPLYKLRSPRKRQLKHEEIGDTVDQLQDICHRFNIPVVMSNQANRALVGTRGEAPSKDSSFGSDAPAQESDVVIGVKHFSDERMMKLSCTKNRFGDPFKFEMSFHPNIGKMEDITPIKGDYYNGYDPEAVAELHKELEESSERTQS